MVDRVEENSVHLQKLLRDQELHFYDICRPSCKCVGVDLMEFAAPDIGEDVSGRKNFNSAAKSLGRQTLEKILGAGNK